MSLFSKIKVTRPRANKFDLSHERKFSMQMGNLVPCFVQEMLPGDQFRVSSEMLVRLAPMLAPVMHRMSVYVHFFKVPNRLIWDEWQDFITGGRLGTSAPVAPYLLIDESDGDSAHAWFGESSLADYLGFPSLGDAASWVNPVRLSALPFRAYSLIYDEYYRDQNVTASIDVPKTSGQVLSAEQDIIMELRKRAWEKDYFTSCLPWAQRGDQVLIPLEAEVTYLDNSLVKRADTGAAITGDTLAGTSASFSPAGELRQKQSLGTDTSGIRIENIDGITNAVVTINDLRTSVQIQKWLEANARGGSRYVELMLVHFGVKSSDARQQRPEFLGGGRANVVVSEVLSTAQFEGATEDLPQGNMAGHGVAVGQANGFSTYCEEHGWIIGICSFLPRTAYQQGIPRQFTRFDKYDYYWREFAHLGEQGVLNKELYYDPESAVPGQADAVFGYQSRYSEYKYAPSTVHGAFRTSLAHWHQGRIFNASPALNQEFVESDPSKRIFAVSSGEVEDLYVQLYNRVDALRLMPYFGTPQFGM